LEVVVLEQQVLLLDEQLMEVGGLLQMDLLVFLEQLRHHFVVDLDEMEHLELIQGLLLLLEELNFLEVMDLVV
jgi:hypothetical protein